ncbi:GIN domain-containing protein [Polaribacter sp. Asnod1-A03]|uniref:GIN domain-containing protein n=1 Tax=Polaribacter sp. Asnod1-A03 TaxID=3160581 RepID=UPI003865D664
MKNKIILLLVLFSIINQAQSQEKIKGNKNITTIETELNSFNKISVKNDFKVVLQKAEKSSIEIETDENIHPIIEFNVINKTLTISTSMKIRESKKLLITVFYKTPITEIELFDDAEIESFNLLEAPDVLVKINDYAKTDISVKSNNFTLTNNNKSRIQLRSKSKLNIDSNTINLALNESSNSEIIIKSDSLNVIMKGNSKLNIEGNADYLESIITESSNLDAKDLNLKNVFSTTKDNSEITVKVSEEIKIYSSDKSKISIYGNAQIILDKFDGISRLYKKEL